MYVMLCMHHHIPMMNWWMNDRQFVYHIIMHHTCIMHHACCTWYDYHRWYGSLWATAHSATCLVGLSIWSAHQYAHIVRLPHHRNAMDRLMRGELAMARSNWKFSVIISSLSYAVCQCVERVKNNILWWIIRIIHTFIQSSCCAMHLCYSYIIIHHTLPISPMAMIMINVRTHDYDVLILIVTSSLSSSHQYHIMHLRIRCFAICIKYCFRVHWCWHI